MAANSSDLFKKTGASTVTTLSAPGKALSATSITVGSTTNYPTDTGIIIAIRIVDSSGELVAGTYTEWSATVTSPTTLGIEAVPVYGSDQVYPAGSTTQVYIPLSSYAHNKLIDGLTNSVLDQDGTLKAGAVDNAAVLASDVVTTAKILDANVTTAKIATDAVTATKIDWASTGADAGIWWEELGRTTLGVAGDTISLTGLSARNHLKVIVVVSPTGGTVSLGIRFNNDSTASYGGRNSSDGGADAVGTSETVLGVVGATTSATFVFEGDIHNNQATKEKLIAGFRLLTGGAGAGNAPGRAEYLGKWANTSAQITRVDVLNLSGSGDFAIGSELIVLGHN